MTMGWRMYSCGRSNDRPGCPGNGAIESAVIGLLDGPDAGLSVGWS